MKKKSGDRMHIGTVKKGKSGVKKDNARRTTIKN